MSKILILLGALTFGLCSQAHAGCGDDNPNCIVPTAPVGTNNNQAASTAFVQQNVPGFLPTLQPSQVLGNNTALPATAAAIPARTQLTGAQNYWVNGNSSATAVCGPTGASTCSAGSDSNNCLTPGTACLTIQHVLNLIQDSVDLAGFTATIYPAHGSSNNYALACTRGPMLGQATVSIQGDANAPTAVVMVATTSVASVKDGCTVGISNVAFADNGSNNASNFVNVGSGNAGHVDLTNISFGALGVGTALVANYAGTITLLGSNSVTGSENAFASVSGGGVIDIVGTVNGSAGITWGTAAAVIQDGGLFNDVTNSTFTGFSGVSGPRCFMSTLPTPDLTNPNSVFPGSIDCVVNFYVGALGVQSGSGGSSTINYGTSGQPLLSQGGAGANPNRYATLGANGGGTGDTSLTANAVMLGAGTGAVQFATVSQGGRVLTDQGANTNPAFATVSGDCGFAANGVITCTETNSVAFGNLATANANTGLTKSGTNLNSNAQTIEKFSPGQLAAVVNTKGSFTKWTKAATVDNLEGSATSFTCSGNPTITFFECGTSTTCASSPTTIGTVTVTAAGTVVDGTVSNPAITAGDYTAWAVTAGTCTALDIVGSANIHSN